MTKEKKEKIICRFAPSPTGFLHVGGVRSALFNYLYAKQNDGKIILRIEDTDKERSKPEYEKDIVEGFKWLGIKFDETLRQTDRTEIYKRYLKNLIDRGLAYVSKEVVTEDNPRAEVIRFKNPNNKVAFDDLIKGRIEFDTTELKDFVIAKSFDEPIFHFTNVIDDHEMGITNVIRGEEHISNTPRQILIQEAIGARRPTYAHIPLILATDRSKLSKRKHGESVSLKFYRARGYLPQAIINFLALLGWNPGNDRELFSLEELVKEFKLDRVQKGGAIFDVEKLNWMNKEYIHKTDKQDVTLEIIRRLDSSEKFSALSTSQKTRLAPAMMERMSYYGQIDDSMNEGEYDYLLKLEEYNPAQLKWKESPDLTESKNNILKVIELLLGLPDFPTKEETKESIWPLAEKNGRGAVLWPVRFALSGRERSVDPFTLISILGKKESMIRLQTAADLIK